MARPTLSDDSASWPAGRGLDVVQRRERRLLYPALDRCKTCVAGSAHVQNHLRKEQACVETLVVYSGGSLAFTNGTLLPSE
jgi:hypothetical protein